LPPPGTVSKKSPEEESSAVSASSKRAASKDPAPEEDDSERVQEFLPLDHRFVGLVIGKAGETIKSFKKQSGASIEIDQNLPDGMPRAVIYRGTRKQVAAAKKLVDTLVQRAKEDEKEKEKSKNSNNTPIGGANTGIMGRGPAGDRDMREISSGDARPSRIESGPSEKMTSNRSGMAGAASSEKEGGGEGVLPPWRRGKVAIVEEDSSRTGGGGQGVEGMRPRNSALRREVPWATKKEKECEAAPSGLFTGALTGGLSMRPAWMKPNKSTAEAPADDAPMLGVFEKSIWNEQKYSRSLLLQAKQKVLRGKAYEAPEEMMTMTTGPRPKWKSEKKEKEDRAASPAPVESTARSADSPKAN